MVSMSPFPSLLHESVTEWNRRHRARSSREHWQHTARALRAACPQLAELRDELMTLLVAGHETTATMPCWAMNFVHHDGRVRARSSRTSSRAARVL